MTHIRVFLSFPFTAALGQRVKVEPEVSSYPGQTVNLRCAFRDATGIQLTMVRYPFTIRPPRLANGLKWPKRLIKCLPVPEMVAHCAVWTIRGPLLSQTGARIIKTQRAALNKLGFFSTPEMLVRIAAMLINKSN